MKFCPGDALGPLFRAILTGEEYADPNLPANGSEQVLVRN